MRDQAEDNRRRPICGNYSRKLLEGRRGGAEAQIQLERLEVTVPQEVDALRLPVAEEQVLAQRRAVVGQVRLGTDQRDPAERPTVRQLRRVSLHGDGRARERRTARHVP